MNLPVRVGDVLVDRSHRWGKKRPSGYIVPSGIYLVDKSIGGIRVKAGGINGVYGIEGSRKTSIVMNIVINQCLSGLLPEGYKIEWDTLESGMTIERVSEIMVCMIASRYITYWNATGIKETDYRTLLKKVPDCNPIELINSVPTVVDGSNEPLRENAIKTDFLETDRTFWTQNQKDAIEVAKSLVARFPVFICGVSEDEDEDRAEEKTTITSDLEVAKKRWYEYADKHGVRQIIVDHINEFQFDDQNEDYGAMLKVVPVMVQWQKKWKGLIWSIAQTGTGQRTTYRNASGDYPTALGGPRLAMTADNMWYVKYHEDHPFWVKMYHPKGRRGKHKPLAIPIDPDSGAMIGRSKFLSSIPDLQ